MQLVWSKAMYKELGRLCQGFGDTEGTNTMRFLDINGKRNIPRDRVVTYAISIFYSIGFSVTFGTLFAKILRVYQLFKGESNMKRIIITARFTFLNICAITSVDVIICLVWTVVDPMHWTRKVLSVDKFGTPMESQGYCTSDHWMVISITIVR